MIRPPFLKKNDQVIIIATAKSFEKNALDHSLRLLESWGLRVSTGKNLFSKSNQFAGTDEQRAHDLQQALDDKNIKAIFCARGGYGTGRIIDKINFNYFLKYPKWIVGFSDITLLHGHVNNLGVQSIHGLMPVLFGKDGYGPSEHSLKETLFGKPVEFAIKPHPLNRMGTTSGVLAGGNLTLLHTSINTASAEDLTGKILFLEDIGEYLYHLDRMTQHLKRAGMLKNLNGLLVGHFTDMKDNDQPFGKTVQEIVLEAVQEYQYPVAFNWPTGHEPDNLPLICGAEARLTVTPDGAALRHLLTATPEII